MVETTLTAEPFLDGYSRVFGDTSLTEITDLALVSVAIPLGGDAKAESAMSNAFGVNIPEIGGSVVAKNNCRILRLSRDQLFVVFSRDTPDAETLVSRQLNNTVYTTDQSDVWVGLEISGPDALPALERICPIDLHSTKFGPGAVARTAMEHLGVIIVRTGQSAYLMLSASSSAISFLRTVEISLVNLD